MATFLLLHGAFRGGWQWDSVADGLRAEGHVVHAPDLPGAGKRVAELEAGIVDLDVCLDDLASYVVDHDLREVVLVGHSQGGFVARALTNRIADRVVILGLLDAPDPLPGQRAVDFGPPGMELPSRDVVLPPRGLEAEGALDELSARRLSRRLSPQPVAIALDPVVLDDPRALAIPVRHAFCDDTPAGYPVEQTRRRVVAAGLEHDLLASPHDAPLCAPNLVVAWLAHLASVR